LIVTFTVFSAGAEPDIHTAMRWWSELPDIWTPIGWKHHLFRYNVLFNGMITAQPDRNSRTTAWQKQGIQLGVYPSGVPSSPYFISEPRDNGSVLQGWSDCAAPVLWSEWVRHGLVLREEIFAHIPGGKAVESGIEPLFAWVRLSVCDSVEGLIVPEKYGFSIKLNAIYIGPRGMVIRHNIGTQPERSAYPRQLLAEDDAYDSVKGWRILEPDGKVRLAVAPGQKCTVRFLPKNPTERDYLMYVEMDAKKGTYVDLLLPMLPTERDVFDKELAVGYDKALDEANCFWSKRPATAAHFETPEEHINNTIKHNLRLTEIIAEKNLATGYTSMLSGSWRYVQLWATPGSMNYVMLLDCMGYHKVVEQFIAMFKPAQGTIKPPGDHYDFHPGYLATPKSLTSVDWLSDHGAILWAISEHALLTGDKKFIDEWTGVIVKACEFIQYARSIEGHGGEPGILPPAVATDMKTKIQAVWNDGWNYKGLTTAVRLLERIKHPRAVEFAAEADAYRKAFVKALRKATKRMLTWTDAKGREHQFVPSAVSGIQPYELRHAFYLDTGPLFLVFAGLMDAEDELMKSTLLWFREGPPSKVYRYDSGCWQLPSLRHEMSSCEPCYSWNVFHSHQQQDRAKYLEGMYSLFAGQISRRTYSACETRGGVTGTTWSCLPVYLARLAVVDDQIKKDELHLMRMMPLAWLRTDRESKFENMPTEFGPVTLRVRLDRNGRELQVSFAPEFRYKPKRVVLHVPPVDGLSKIRVNEKDLNWDRKKQILEIP